MAKFIEIGAKAKGIFDTLFPKSKGPTAAQVAAQTEQRKTESQRQAELLSEGGERRRGRAAGRAGRQLLSFNPLLGSDTTLG